jgi:DNA-binding MarR family transcriptional regulator
VARITASDGVDRIVDQWADERPELDTEAMAVFGRIYRLARAAGDRQEKAYAAHGISRGEFDVLASLRRSGAPYQLSPKALCAALMLTTGGMTGRLDRLERAGLVTRSPDPADRRALVITLTGEGLRVVEASVEAGLAVQQSLLAHLPPGKRATLNTLLRDVLSAVEKQA